MCFFARFWGKTSTNSAPEQNSEPHWHAYYIQSVENKMPVRKAAKQFNIPPVTYIRVTGHFIFRPYRYVMACVTWLTPGAPFIVHTQNGNAACVTAAFIGTLKSALRRKCCILITIENTYMKYCLMLCFCNAKTNLFELWPCQYRPILWKLLKSAKMASSIPLSLWRIKLQTWLRLCLDLSIFIN